MISEISKLAKTHQRIKSCVDNINKCMGPILLLHITANLYSIVFNMYCYATATEGKIACNSREQFVYFVIIAVRLIEFFVYIWAGHFVSTKVSRI